MNPATTTAAAEPAAVLQVLIIAGLMGMIGQMVRAMVGLKKIGENDPARGEAFSAGRLFISLGIGFSAGILAALALETGRVASVAIGEAKTLLALMAAGYAGTDFIEGLLPRFLPQAAVAQANAQTAPASSSGGHEEPPPRPAILTDAGRAAHEASLIPQLSGISASMKLQAAAADITGKVTPELVKSMFPAATPLKNIKDHLGAVLAALSDAGLGDRSMVAMAVATIRAETEGFVPISEFQSQYNTNAAPFDLYEPSTPKGIKLGNAQPGDGARYRGRGFVQLTGRYNYTAFGGELNLDLAGNPELANDSVSAGRILAAFLDGKEGDIRAALAAGNLKKARKLVNGGSHGFDRFKDTYDKAVALLPAA